MARRHRIGVRCVASFGAHDLARLDDGRCSHHDQRQHECSETSDHLCQYTPAHRLVYSRARRSLSALPMTETELKLIAAAAIIGDSSRPKNGYSTPAAIGTPAEL